MFTQIVMMSTIFLLVFSGKRIFQKSKAINYSHGKIFSLGLFFVATGILFYAIRDIFVQLKMYEVQIYFAEYGAILHLIGGFLLLWFFSKEFVPRFFRYVFGLFSFLMISFLIIATGKVFTIEGRLQLVPFEPFPYYVMKNFITSSLGNGLLLGIIIGVSLLIFGIVLYNSLEEEQKTLRLKGLFYGIGILLLIAPMVICMLISPIYARIAYLIGAFLIYETLRIKA